VGAHKSTGKEDKKKKTRKVKEESRRVVRNVDLAPERGKHKKKKRKKKKKKKETFRIQSYPSAYLFLITEAISMKGFRHDRRVAGAVKREG